MNANGGPMQSVNGGRYRSTEANTANPKGLRRAATGGHLQMRRTVRVVVNVRINAATVIVAIAALIKVLT